MNYSSLKYKRRKKFPTFDFDMSSMYPSVMSAVNIASAPLDKKVDRTLIEKMFGLSKHDL